MEIVDVPFHITQALLNQFTGGQIEIKQYGKSHALYCGAIQTINLDPEGILSLHLVWLVRADHPPAIEPSWTRDDRNTLEIDLIFYRPSFYEEGMLCLIHDAGDQTLIFYQRDSKKRIDPAVTRIYSPLSQRA